MSNADRFTLTPKGHQPTSDVENRAQDCLDLVDRIDRALGCLARIETTLPGLRNDELKHARHILMGRAAYLLIEVAREVEDKASLLKCPECRSTQGTEANYCDQCGHKLRS